mmetsp:Transcript_36715/g.56397  ORF Transcript_36715/g.56397 Transcript_36715/m.56397 type:complete len:90 (+) Transcript_36715:434-703(+)
MIEKEETLKNIIRNPSSKKIHFDIPVSNYTFYFSLSISTILPYRSPSHLQEFLRTKHRRHHKFDGGHKSRSLSSSSPSSYPELLVSRGQ